MRLHKWPKITWLNLPKSNKFDFYTCMLCIYVEIRKLTINKDLSYIVYHVFAKISDVSLSGPICKKLPILYWI